MCDDHPELDDDQIKLDIVSLKAEDMASLLSETESDGIYEDEEDEAFDLDF